MMTTHLLTHNSVDRKAALKALLRHESQLFQQHRTAYLALGMAKLALLAAFLHFGYTQRIGVEVLTLFALAAVGLGMTILFHRQEVQMQAEARDDAHTLLRPAAPPERKRRQRRHS
jgi:hypothetical protein